VPYTINLMLLTSSVTSLIVHLMQTLSEFEQDIIDTVIGHWDDHLVVDTSNICTEMNFLLCDLSEHFNTVNAI